MNGESARLWSVPHLNNLRLMRATYITYAFSRHVHDYFAIGVIESGVQTFSYRHQRTSRRRMGCFSSTPASRTTAKRRPRRASPTV